MYNVVFNLISDSIGEYTQRHMYISLSDFEYIYGAITDEIINITLNKTEESPCNTPVTMIQ